MSDSKNSIADERETERLEKKYRVKPPHERDITGITRAFYLLLHAGSGLGAVSCLWYFERTNKIQFLVFFVVFAALAVLNEVMKGEKMEYFCITKILSEDTELEKTERDKAYDDMKKAFLATLIWWVISVASVSFTGYKFGESKQDHKFTAENYDQTLKNAADASITALAYGTQEGYSQKAIQRLQKSQKEAVSTWEQHTKNTDNANFAAKNTNDDEALFMGLVYALIGILFEGCLFWARLWHEKEQYAVKKSREAAAKTAKKEAKAAENTEKQQKTQKEVILTNSDINFAEYQKILAVLKAMGVPEHNGTSTVKN